MFHFESICVQEDKFTHTDKKNLDQQPRSNTCINFVPLDWRTNFFLQFQPQNFGWVTCWCSWRLAIQSEGQMKLKTSVNKKLNQIICPLDQRRRRKEPVLEIQDNCVDQS